MSEVKPILGTISRGGNSTSVLAFPATEEENWRGQRQAESVTGYLHEAYAAALSEQGVPHYLPGAGGWVLERAIPGFQTYDAMGCYPLFACRSWERLADDLNNLKKKWVSLTVVTEPFADTTEEILRKAFPDLVKQYKHHFVVKLGREPGAFVDPHHLRNARRARHAVRVYEGVPTGRLLEVWCVLYRNLIHHRTIRGMAAFSDSSFAAQLRVPGMVIQWAESEGEIVGMVLWYRMGKRAYYHLGAYSEAGYAARCSFALFFDAIESFSKQGVEWLGLGAGAGAANDGTDGLTRFKRGWATETRPTYLCGRVFDPHQYQALRAVRGLADGGYFPAYRAGEFQ